MEGGRCCVSPWPAAPVNHQSAESLTEILKRLCAGAQRHRGGAACAAAYVTGTVAPPVAVDRDGVKGQNKTAVADASCLSENGPVAPVRRWRSARLTRTRRVPIGRAVIPRMRKSQRFCLVVCLPEPCLLPEQRWVSCR